MEVSSISGRAAILDFGSFTRRWLLMECMLPADTWGGEESTERAEGARPETRGVEDREATVLSVMGK